MNRRVCAISSLFLFLVSCLFLLFDLFQNSILLFFLHCSQWVFLPLKTDYPAITIYFHIFLIFHSSLINNIVLFQVKHTKILEFIITVILTEPQSYVQGICYLSQLILKGNNEFFELSEVHSFFNNTIVVPDKFKKQFQNNTLTGPNKACHFCCMLQIIEYYAS